MSISTLIYRSKLSPSRLVRHNVLEVEELRVNDMIVTVPTPAQTKRRRCMHMHLDRVSGNVFLFRPGTVVEVGGPRMDRIWVGTHGVVESVLLAGGQPLC